MEIRKAQPQDVQYAAQVESVCFPAAEAASPKAIAERIAAFSDHFWMLWDGQTPVGFINGMVTDTPHLEDEMYENTALHNENGAWQMVFGLDVVPEYQHKGYASMLMRHLIDRAKQEKRSGVVLTCKETLIGFYEQFGFVCEGVSESQHGGVCWYEMRLTLKE